MLAFLGSKSRIRLFISCEVVSSNTNLSPIVTFSFILKILGCRSYCLIISSILPLQAFFAVSERYGSISRHCTASIKKVFNFSATIVLSV